MNNFNEGMAPGLLGGGGRSMGLGFSHAGGSLSPRRNNSFKSIDSAQDQPEEETLA